MKSEIQQFQRELNQSSGAKSALEDRSFLPEVISEFEVGYCPAYAGYDFDLLNGRIVLPIYDVYDNWIAFCGRKVDAYSKDVKNYYQQKTNKFEGLNKFFKWKTSKWINTPYQKSHHLYNLNKAKKHIFASNYCIVVEGYFDVMRLHQLGYKNVVALCGTSLSERHCELIYRYCNKVLIMLDGDEAGKIATQKSLIKVRNNGLFANIAELPEGQDPDDLTKETLEFINSQITEAEEEIYIKL
jgi:DNA primase